MTKGFSKVLEKHAGKKDIPYVSIYLALILLDGVGLKFILDDGLKFTLVLISVAIFYIVFQKHERKTK